MFNHFNSSGKENNSFVKLPGVTYWNTENGAQSWYSTYKVLSQLSDGLDIATARVLPMSGGTRLCHSAVFWSSCVLPHPASWFSLIPISTPHINTTCGIVMGCPFSSTHGVTTTPSPSQGSYPLLDILHQRGHTSIDHHTTLCSSIQVVLGQLGDFLPLPLGAWTTVVLPLPPLWSPSFLCIKIGICTGSNETRECLVKYKTKQDIVHRCPNCNQAHHACNKSCLAHLRLIELDREEQAAWVTNQ